MAFAGMLGRALARQMISQRVNAAAGAVNAGGGYRGAFQSSGKYLFVAHPNCCDKCTKMNGTLWNTPDVAFISHPNCMCATIEVPAGLSPAEVMEWSKNPVGIMRFGFNYGESLKPVQLTVNNRDKVFAQWKERMSPDGRSAHPRRLVRAKVSQEQIDAMKARAKAGELPQGIDLTKKIEGYVKAASTRKLKKTEAGKLAEKMLGGAKKTKIVLSQGKNRQRSGPLELPKLKQGDVWNPNRGKAKKAFVERLNRRNTAVSSRNGYGSELQGLKKLSSGASNFEFSQALMGAARMLKGSRSKAMKSYSDRMKEKKRREKEELDRLKRIGLL